MEEIHIVNVGLEASLQRELDTLWGNADADEAENFTIFRTPHNISKRKKDLFEPSVISIGPFHRSQKHLRVMEEQKRRFLRDFLSRKNNISLDLYISEMKLLETRTRRCYSETFDDLDSDTFVEMMLLDGCFVLEYFSKKKKDNLKSILEVGWNHHFIKSDLLLQENQIPFFIVEKLYELIGFNQDHRMALVKYIVHNLLPRDSIIAYHLAKTPNNTYSYPIDLLADIPDPPAEIHHLVHLYYRYIVPNPEKPLVLSFKLFDLTTMFCAYLKNKAMFCTYRINVFLHRFPNIHSWVPRTISSRQRPDIPIALSRELPNSTDNLSSMVIPSATELKEAGLKFTPKSNPLHMLDISLEYGFLKIPRLKITDYTKPIFANLIAFEHSQYGIEHSPFTSFVYFLDNLVNTPNDIVRILQECGIIENWLGSEEEVTHFINQATEGACIGGNHYLAELYTEVNKYSKKSWNRHRAKLVRDYFSSPWAIVSLVAAFILLVLTFLQSFYAIYAYYIPSSS